MTVFPRRKFAEAGQPARPDGVQISKAQLEDLFHLPLPQAAMELGICTTSAKKLCRKFGISKWPYCSWKAKPDRRKQSDQATGRNVVHGRPLYGATDHLSASQQAGFSAPILVSSEGGQPGVQNGSEPVSLSRMMHLPHASIDMSRAPGWSYASIPANNMLPAIRSPSAPGPVLNAAWFNSALAAQQFSVPVICPSPVMLTGNQIAMLPSMSAIQN